MKLDDKALLAKANRRLIFFTTDAGFLLPTIQAAMQVAAQPKVLAIADMLIFLVDMTDEDKAALDAAFADQPFRFELLPMGQLGQPDGTVFNQTHVPRSTLARLSTADAIPAHYEHLIYLDGDIQIVGDIQPLVAHDVVEGKIAAANDTTWMCAGDRGGYWRGMRGYLDGLGVADAKDYFNAGILAFRRSTWTEIAPAARQFFLENSAACRYHDQSALNAVCAGRREILSPAYNFISGYAELGVQRETGLRIIHFTGAAKPWHCRGWPWYGQFFARYQNMLTRFPVLDHYAPKKSPEAIAGMEREVLQARRLATLRAPWRKPLRRRLYRRYLTATQFDVA